MPVQDTARLWHPPLALAGCVRAAMLRDTHGRALSPAQRESYFPVSPLVSLLWWQGAEVEWVARPGFAAPPPDFQPGPVMLGGPFILPSHFRAQGPVRGVQLMLFPDAFQALTGVEVSRLVNRSVPAQSLLPDDWRRWIWEVQAAPDDADKLARIEAFLLPRWAALGAQRPPLQRYADWAQGLAVRAATSASGRSLRQIERRVKAWAGLPMREVRAISRGERAFLAAMSTSSDVNWADIAAETDYADQSHLCRETRRFTGFSPAELRQRILTDEAFWVYRLWR